MEQPSRRVRRGQWFNGGADQPLALSTTGMPYDPHSQRWLSPLVGDNGYVAFANPHTRNVAPQNTAPGSPADGRSW